MTTHAQAVATFSTRRGVPRELAAAMLRDVRRQHLRHDTQALLSNFPTSIQVRVSCDDITL
jgi:hypothetical protein